MSAPRLHGFTARSTARTRASGSRAAFGRHALAPAVAVALARDRHRGRGVDGPRAKARCGRRALRGRALAHVAVAARIRAARPRARRSAPALAAARGATLDTARDAIAGAAHALFRAAVLLQ